MERALLRDGNVTFYHDAFGGLQMSDEDLGIVIDDSPALSDLPENDNDPGAAPPIAPATPAQAPEETPPAETEDQKTARLAREAFETRNAKRELKELREKLAAMEQAQSQKPRPEIPALPDPLATNEQDFNRARETWEEAIRQAAIYDAQQLAIQDQQRATEQARQLERQEALNKAVDGYKARSVQLGVNLDELKGAGEMVQRFITDLGVTEMILNDDKGPLITKYFSQNVEEMEAVANMTPINAAIYIASVVKPKAASLKPKVSGAPDPIERPGSSVLPRDYGVEGATYE